LKKLAEQLAARNIATLRYDKRGAGGWKKEFGKPEDFRFKDFVDDAAALVDYLRNSGKFARLRLQRRPAQADDQEPTEQDRADRDEPGGP